MNFWFVQAKTSHFWGQDSSKFIVQIAPKLRYLMNDVFDETGWIVSLSQICTWFSGASKSGCKFGILGMYSKCKPEAGFREICVQFGKKW